jgi:hypothetical protein
VATFTQTQNNIGKGYYAPLHYKLQALMELKELFEEGEEKNYDPTRLIDDVKEGRGESTKYLGLIL